MQNRFRNPQQGNCWCDSWYLFASWILGINVTVFSRIEKRGALSHSLPAWLTWKKLSSLQFCAHSLAGCGLGHLSLRLCKEQNFPLLLNSNEAGSLSRSTELILPLSGSYIIGPTLYFAVGPSTFSHISQSIYKLKKMGNLSVEFDASTLSNKLNPTTFWIRTACPWSTMISDKRSPT